MIYCFKPIYFKLSLGRGILDEDDSTWDSNVPKKLKELNSKLINTGILEDLIILIPILNIFSSDPSLSMSFCENCQEIYAQLKSVIYQIIFTLIS